MKILVILGIIFSVFLLGTALLLRFVKNLFGFKNIGRRDVNVKFEQKDNDVIYKKDDIVVLKGDAKRN